MRFSPTTQGSFTISWASEERIASFRISRIADMRILSSSAARSGSLSRLEKKEIEEKIARDHVQFLVGEREECVVHLTEKGRRMYNQIQYMKPLVSFVDEDGNYHFECSAFQCYNYFYRFGENARIIAPSSLRESLLNEYKNAYEAYLEAEEGLNTISSGPYANMRNSSVTNALRIILSLIQLILPNPQKSR